MVYCFALYLFHPYEETPVTFNQKGVLCSQSNYNIYNIECSMCMYWQGHQSNGLYELMWAPTLYDYPIHTITWVHDQKYKHQHNLSWEISANRQPFATSGLEPIPLLYIAKYRRYITCIVAIVSLKSFSWVIQLPNHANCILMAIDMIKVKIYIWESVSL